MVARRPKTGHQGTKAERTTWRGGRKDDTRKEGPTRDDNRRKDCVGGRNIRQERPNIGQERGCAQWSSLTMKLARSILIVHIGTMLVLVFFAVVSCSSVALVPRARFLTFCVGVVVVDCAGRNATLPPTILCSALVSTTTFGPSPLSVTPPFQSSSLVVFICLTRFRVSVRFSAYSLVGMRLLAHLLVRIVVSLIASMV